MWYIDLRQGPNRPDFSGVTWWDELDPEQLRWILTQEAFAGKLLPSASAVGTFTWSREVDWAPSEGLVDCGTLHFESGRMVERGAELPYLEHWHRCSPIDVPRAVAVARDPETGATAIALRAGELFAVARGRRFPAAVTEDQRELTGPQLRHFVDCEVSFGRVSTEGWIVTASTWTFQEGRECLWHIDSERIQVPTADSPVSTETWPVEITEGDPGLFTDLLSAQEML